MEAKDLEIIKTINSLCYDVEDLVDNVEFSELFSNSATYNDCLFILRQIGVQASKLPIEIRYLDCLSGLIDIEKLKDVFDIENTEKNRDYLWKIIVNVIPILTEGTDELYKENTRFMQLPITKTNKPRLVLVK